MEPFKLINIAKYAKNHYNRTDSIWYDLALCLQADNYGPFFGYTNEERTPQEECYRSPRDITELIVHRVEPLLSNRPHSRAELLRTISPQDCWKVGYEVKSHWDNDDKSQDELPNYDYWEAVVRAYTSQLSMMTHDELGYSDWSEFEKANVPQLKKKKEIK